jgi:drug/metabolite transporter (DMT)-like permease
MAGSILTLLRAKHIGKQMVDFLMRPGILVISCALAYAGATLVMKSLSSGPNTWLLALLAVALAAAVVAEIMLLRRQSLGITYITILGAETIVVLGFAVFLGEGLGLRQLAGAALVLAGTAVIWA